VGLREDTVSIERALGIVVFVLVIVFLLAVIAKVA
jgi:hypothetical protein